MRANSRTPRLAAVAVMLGTGCFGLATVERSLSEPAAAKRGGEPPAPNIVVVMTDDQATSQVGPLYLPRTTRLLQDEGTTFENAFLTTPLCCPSRASLLTGQYGHNNGVLTNSYRYLRGERNVLPAWLRRAGYVTAHVGKFLNRYHRDDHPAAVAPGWDQWYTQLDTSQDTYYDWDMSRNGHRRHYGSRPRDYAPRVFERDAVRLTRRFVPRSRPLYLQVDELAPHPGLHQRTPGCGAIPDARDVGKHDDVELPQPPSFNEADLRDKPRFISRQPPLAPKEVNRMTRRYRCGLASLEEVDRTVGHLYRELQRLGELWRTVFIFYTDNGVFYGEHRIGGGKLYPYEEADRTPLYIRLPPPYRSGLVSRVIQPVANIDLAPTILRLAHARPCRAPGQCRVLDGRNLLPLLRGKSPSWASQRPLGVELDIAYVNKKHAVCKYAGVRVPGAIFIRHSRVASRSGHRCVRHVERERYDLRRDPDQLHNLCFGGRGCPKDPRQRKLRRLLAKISHCSGVHGRDPRRSARPYCG
jgi:N-acetylglucosamine-6-sulfatase